MTTPLLRHALVLGALLTGRLFGAVHTLDDPASPIAVTFDSNGGRLTVTRKADGFVWKNPAAGGGTTLTIGAVTQSDATHLVATASAGAASVTLAWALDPATGKLSFTLDGASANVGGGLLYPFPFFAADGSGYLISPVDGGYVVPVSQTTFSPPAGMRAMEFFGGTDDANERGWIAIVETPDDCSQSLRTGTVSAGVTRIGVVPTWRGSNGNAARNGQLLTYPRRLTYEFFASGGYVTAAKKFRANAQSRGWLKTFREKQQANPALDLSQLIGAPVVYLWGDGRSTALLDAMKNAGIDKALVQVSVNHVDQNKNFPASSLAGTAWFDAIRQRGYIGGFYDIYAAMRTGGQGGSPYDGFYYLWPQPTASTQWVSVLPNGQLDTRGTISAQKAASFAANTRMPAHLTTFDMDAYFFDVVCAVDLLEDYDLAFGHFATRSQDRANRLSLLSVAATAGLYTASEQGRSWAVPVLHWAEGKEWLGTANLALADGSFNDNSYPEIMVDAIDPTTMAAGNMLPSLLSDGFKAPLWDLVFHDCVVATVHWHRSHNKYLYAWDHADRSAMLRGQAPLLNLTFDGVKGLANRQPNSRTDAFGNVWTSRWNVIGARVVQTYNNVSKWHGQVGWMEMIDHRRLTSDRSVQLSEFSEDGGLSGRGIVVNFGVYDGAYGVGAGTTWTGTVRGQAISVVPGQTQTYEWSPVTIATTALPDAATSSAYTTTLQSAGGVAPISWSLAAGALPLGLALDSATGVIDGTPTTVGIFDLMVRATDAAGSTATKSLSLLSRDTTAPILALPSPIVVEAAGASGTEVAFAVSAVDNIDGAVAATTSQASGSLFPLGTTTVQVTATDAAGNTSSSSFTVTVHDTTAPAFTALTPSVASLWPANHKMIAVTLNAVAADVGDAAPALRIVSVSSNEPVDGVGDGDTSPDWEITGNLTLKLRAERAGGGTGRVYTITVEASDASGNVATATTTVTVPKNQSGKAIAVVWSSPTAVFLPPQLSLL